MLAGCTTFATLAYALLLIPRVLAETGMDPGAVITATLLSAGMASLVMGLYANYPFVLAPGIVLTVYFSEVVVLARGHRWESALGVVFIGGVVFLILNLLKIRQLIIETIPKSLQIGVMAGMGIFLAFIGIKHLGEVEGVLPLVIAFISLISICVFMVLRIPGGLFIGIIISWLLALVFKVSSFEGLFSLPSSLMPTFFKLDVRAVFNLRLLDTVIAFLFIGLFDISAVLSGLAKQGDFLKPCPTSKKKCHIPRLSKALMADSTGSVLASFLGTTTLSVYMESAAGISAGGRTGLTSVTAALLFFVALFFTPLISSIPLFALSAVLLVVGGQMVKKIALLEWKDPSEWIPAFATMVLIPFTRNIATGIGVGFILFPLIKLLLGRVREMHPFLWVIFGLFVLKFVLL